MIWFNAPIRISAPPPLECVFVNKRPYYNIKVRVRINIGSFSANCSQTNGNATLQKQWSSSNFLNHYVHVSASILQTDDLFFKFCGDCSAGLCGEEESRDNKSIFQLACEQALLFGRAKRTREQAAKPRGACLLRVYFSRYPPNGELARRLFSSLLDLHVVPFTKYSSFNFEHSVFSQKRDKHLVLYKRPPLR